MEVHAPEHPIHTWRDFFIHIATITIGLLIALALEQTVEAIHHRHIVLVTRENIRREMERNEKNTQENLAKLSHEAQVMTANVEKARLLRDNPKAMGSGEMSFAFSFSSLDQAAWLSARDSGALAYMPSEEVQRYADVYSQQQLLTDAAIETSTQQIEAAGPLVAVAQPSDLSHEEAERLLQESARVLLRITALRQFVQQLDDQYKQTLKL